MSEKSRATLKTYFEAGDTPTEAEFIDLIDSFACLKEDKYLFLFQRNITAYNGGGQANATVINYKTNHVENSTNPGDSVKFEASSRAVSPLIINTSGNAIDLFPPSGQSFNLLAADIAISIANNTAKQFFYTGNDLWVSEGAL